MRRFLARLTGIATVTAIVVTGALPAFADTPAQPNCLGTDSATFAQNGIPAFGVSSGSGFGQFHLVLAQNGAPGVGDVILAHLQGATPVASCPDNGFPSPFPRP